MELTRTEISNPRNFRFHNISESKMVMFSQPGLTVSIIIGNQVYHYYSSKPKKMMRIHALIIMIHFMNGSCSSR